MPAGVLFLGHHLFHSESEIMYLHSQSYLRYRYIEDDDTQRGGSAGARRPRRQGTS